MRLLFRHDEKIEKIEELTRELKKNPAVAAFRKEAAAENLKKREAAADRLSVLKQKAVELAENQDTDSLEEKLSKVDAERLKLQSEIAKKRVAIIQEKAGLEGQIRNEEEILYASYDPRIDDSVEFFQDKLNELRSPGKISTQRTDLVGKNIFSEKIKSKFENNLGAINLAIKYCQSAIASLEASKLMPSIDFAKIEELKKNIPKTDIFTEGESVRQMPGTRTPNPLSLLPSDSEMEWKKNKVLDKARKILQR